MKNIILLVFITFLSAEYFQIDSLMIGGIERKYYVSNPNDYNEPTPLIIHMHGFTGTPYGAMNGTKFDIWGVDYSQITMVYPEGMLNTNGQSSWNVGTYWDQNNYDDVGFISAMIDSISEDYNIDLDRVYACGFSNGGYMAYRLACELSDKIAAFGSVTGNFKLNDAQNCNNNREVPIIHIHGTNDPIVSYFSPNHDTSLTAIESMNYWSNFNNLTNIDSTNLGFAAIGNIWHYTASSDFSNTRFEHYKYVNMIHSWMWFPDYFPFGTLNTYDGNLFNSTRELINFFLDYRLSDFLNEDLLGDVNIDGEINIVDTVQLVGFILEQLEFSYTQEQLADINQDGNINIVDVVQLVQLILNS